MVFGEDRIRRDLRRYHLAMRLIAHEARTGTICDWTGLTREKLKTLRRDWGVPQEARHRGPSPSSVAAFFRSPRVRSEASSIAILCCALGAVPRGKVSNAARVLPSLDRGESLCDAFETFRAYFPRSAIDIEQAILLVMSLAKGELLELGRCKTCDAVILIDRLSAARRTCSYCHRRAGQKPLTVPIASAEITDDNLSTPQRRLL